MKNRTQTSLEVAFSVSVPVTNEEYDQIAGKTDAACARAVDSYMHHSWLGDFRSAFVAAVEERTAVERIKEVKGEDGTVITKAETEAKYFKRVLATTGEEAADFNELAQEVSDKLPFDPSTKTRAAKPSKAHFEQAGEIAAAVDRGESTWERVVKNLEAAVPGLIVNVDADGIPSQDELAQGIKLRQIELAKNPAGILG